MTNATDILIVGAGPTGLAAALFLAERGRPARVIERRLKSSQRSKAFGVNARSLELLAGSGVTEQFLAGGRRLRRLNLRHEGHVLATLRLDHVDHQYPFMLIQSQAESERILEEALTQQGIEVERGVEAVDARVEDGRAVVEVTAGGERSMIVADRVLAADGARSGLRAALALPFHGEAYDEPWRLYDVELETPLPADEAHVLILSDGGMFMVRHSSDVWRVLGNVPHMLERLPPGTRVGKTLWESEFDIANRVAGEFARPPFYLAGDAAHIHSGIGARGMNLGIEDAYVFAALHTRGQLDRYDHLRRPRVRNVVSQIRRAMGPPRPQTLPGRIVRSAPWLVSAVVPLVRQPAQQWVLGLDHDLGL